MIQHLYKSWFAWTKTVQTPSNSYWTKLIISFLGLRGVLEYPEHPPPPLWYATGEGQLMGVPGCTTALREWWNGKSCHEFGNWLMESTGKPSWCLKLLEMLRMCLDHDKSGLMVTPRYLKNWTGVIGQLLTSRWKIRHPWGDYCLLQEIHRPLHAIPEISPLVKYQENGKAGTVVGCGRVQVDLELELSNVLHMMFQNHLESIVPNTARTLLFVLPWW